MANVVRCLLGIVIGVSANHIILFPSSYYIVSWPAKVITFGCVNCAWSVSVEVIISVAAEKIILACLACYLVIAPFPVNPIISRTSIDVLVLMISNDFRCPCNGIGENCAISVFSSHWEFNALHTAVVSNLPVVVFTQELKLVWFVACLAVLRPQK